MIPNGKSGPGSDSAGHSWSSPSLEGVSDHRETND